MQKLEKVTRCFVLLALGLPRLTLVVVWLNHELCISKPQVTAQLCPGWILLSLLVLLVWRVIEWLVGIFFVLASKAVLGQYLLVCWLISTWYVWTRMQRVDNWHPVGRIEDDLSLWQASRARQGWDGMGWWGFHSSQLFCQASAAVLCLTCQCNARLATTLVQAYNTAHYVVCVA